MPKLKREYGNNKDTIYWFAGIFEGEGSVSLRMMTVTQKDTWILLKIKELFGGTVSEIRNDGTTQWWLCGKDARDLIDTIYPILSPRRQIQITEKFLTHQKFEAMKLERKNNPLHYHNLKRQHDENGRFIKLNNYVYA